LPRSTNLPNAANREYGRPLFKQINYQTSDVVLLPTQVWLTTEHENKLTASKERIMQSACKIEDRSRLASEAYKSFQAPCVTRHVQQILVPVDLTNDCRVGINYAIRLAKTFGSTVNLLHLYQEPYVLNQSPRSRNCDVFKQQREKIFADFYNLLQKTGNQYPDSVGYFEYGHPDHEICNIARRLHADLLILSMHKEKCLEHLVFGRHAERILANSPCPVLVVHERETDFCE
jgi:nucleotide-binding universal stress UspA family protein